MKVLMFGAGVIGTIYGYVLAEAGNDVTHYVRMGKKKTVENGIPIRLLDGRQKNPKDKEILYKGHAVEQISPQDNYDLFIVSVRHYQMESILPLLQNKLGNADVLFFNGNWSGFEFMDQYLPRAKYLWGYPVAGGGYRPGGLDAAILDNVQIGELDGELTPRLERIREMFGQAGLKAEVQQNIRDWLWVHFAINCGVIGAAFKARGARELLNSVPGLRLGILAGREALEVCKARGVNVEAFEDAKSFYSPTWLGAVAIWLMMKTNQPARKIFERHTAADELQRMYYDLLKTGEELKIPMPYYKSFKEYIDHPPVLT